MNNINKVRIVLADGQYFFRRGLRIVLATEPDFEISGEADTLDDCLALVRSGSPDLVLIEEGLADEQSRSTLRRLCPTSALLVVAEDAAAERRLRSHSEACIIRNQASLQVVGAIRKVCRLTANPVNSAEAAADLQALARSTNQYGNVPGLTTRETEVVRILAEGRTARQVADELGLSIKTVEAHKLNVMRKLGVHNRAALLRYAAQNAIS